MEEIDSHLTYSVLIEEESPLPEAIHVHPGPLALQIFMFQAKNEEGPKPFTFQVKYRSIGEISISNQTHKSHPHRRSSTFFESKMQMDQNHLHFKPNLDQLCNLYLNKKKMQVTLIQDHSCFMSKMLMDRSYLCFKPNTDQQKKIT